MLASHDSDTRYNSPEARARIASIYLPLLSITMDNFQHLYKGADGWEDWTTTFERNTEVRRSVVIREGVDGSLELDSLVCTHRLAAYTVEALLKDTPKFEDTSIIRTLDQVPTSY